MVVIELCNMELYNKIIVKLAIIEKKRQKCLTFFYNGVFMVKGGYAKDDN